MTIAVDFDGTIVEDRYPAIGKPVPYAFETLLSLQKKGHRIILWTVREGERLQEAVDFCRSNGLEFYAVNSETPEAWAVDNVPSPRKLRADVYIDDRGVAGLPEWTTIGKIIGGEMDAAENPGGVRRGWADGRYAGRTSSRKGRKRGFFGCIAERCRRARAKFG